MALKPGRRRCQPSMGAGKLLGGMRAVHSTLSYAPLVQWTKQYGHCAWAFLAIQLPTPADWAHRQTTSALRCP